MQPWQPLITFWFGEETDDVTAPNAKRPSGGAKQRHRRPARQPLR